MTDHERHDDDLDAYIADYDPAEREELAAAELAIDLAMLFQRARESRAVSQATIAERIGLSQQAVSRMEQPHRNVTIETLRRYLGALGYGLEITVKEPESGKVLESVSLAPLEAQPRRRRASAPAVS